MTPSNRESRPLAWLGLLALGACAGTLLAGVGTALTYTGLATALQAVHLALPGLRAVHESFAFAWVFLGGVAVVYLYMFREHGPPGRAARRRIAWQVTLWAIAGMGILVTLLAGRFTGREYFGFHPAFSVLIAAGWLLFAWNFFGRSRASLRGQPVYIYMWSVAIPLFLITFLEGHAYLLDIVSQRPVRDLAIQWKSNGTMVGAFNQLAYGSLIYVSGCIRGNDDYAHSRTAFGLFFIGVLNTFSNYGHHTYHLPQSPWIHWVSFVVSMLEVILLVKVFLDLVGMLRTTSRRGDRPAAEQFIRFGTLWTFLLLLLALLIAVPPVNALIHGTHVVVAHSMGSMIGIDSMILWAGLAWLVGEVVGPDHIALKGRRFRLALPVLSAFLVVFLLSYLAHGAAVGWSRYLGPSAPDPSWLLELFPLVMVVSGIGLAATALWMIAGWMIALAAR